MTNMSSLDWAAQIIADVGSGGKLGEAPVMTREEKTHLQFAQVLLLQSIAHSLRDLARSQKK